MFNFLYNIEKACLIDMPVVRTGLPRVGCTGNTVIHCLAQLFGLLTLPACAHPAVSGSQCVGGQQLFAAAARVRQGHEREAVVGRGGRAIGLGLRRLVHSFFNHHHHRTANHYHRRRRRRRQR